MQHIYETVKLAKDASYKLSIAGISAKNSALNSIADALEKNFQDIISANKIDLENGIKKGLSASLQDRLMLNEQRISEMANGLRSVASLPDPIGETLRMWKRENGLNIGIRRVPLGVVGIIYEARPNVTTDAIALCLKTGNSCVLRGGSEAINTNKKIAEICRTALRSTDIDENCIALIEDTTHDGVNYLMTLRGLIDVLIPRGGEKLISAVVNNSVIPVIETGTGNCHVYADKHADIGMAVDILFNAKTQRVSVCNACESVLVHKDIAKEFLPLAFKRLSEKNVEWRGCEKTIAILGDAVKPATEEDFAAEFYDYIISCKVVNNIDEAISHINKYSTSHSEAIITNDYLCAKKFEDEVDSSCVYVNASTRFTDGYVFGFGAEIGISTQKLHARGPMGLNELTTVKYIIEGDGQIRS